MPRRGEALSQGVGDRSAATVTGNGVCENQNAHEGMLLSAD